MRYLKRNGMEKGDLIKVYQTMIRPAVEYAAVVYHTLIPEYLSDQLESVQRHATKIIYGWHVSYTGLLEAGEVETLKNRRIDAVKRFALKSEQDKRWYKPKEELERNVRTSTRNKYEEKRCSTERDKKNPVYNMTKVLNEHYKS